MIVEVFHGGNTGHCVAPLGERHEELDFDCIDCGRRICWCFGTGCDIDLNAGAGQGLCCDCWCQRQEGNQQ